MSGSETVRRGTLECSRCFVWVSNLVCTLKVEHRLRMLENRELREICGPERKEMIRDFFFLFTIPPSLWRLTRYFILT